MEQMGQILCLNTHANKIGCIETTKISTTRTTTIEIFVNGHSRLKFNELVVWRVLNQIY